MFIVLIVIIFVEFLLLILLLYQRHLCNRHIKNLYETIRKYWDIIASQSNLSLSLDTLSEIYGVDREKIEVFLEREHNGSEKH